MHAWLVLFVLVVSPRAYSFIPRTLQCSCMVLYNMVWCSVVQYRQGILLGQWKCYAD